MTDTVHDEPPPVDIEGFLNTYRPQLEECWVCQHEFEEDEKVYPHFEHYVCVEHRRLKTGRPILWKSLETIKKKGGRR